MVKKIVTSFCMYVSQQFGGFRFKFFLYIQRHRNKQLPKDASHENQNWPRSDLLLLSIIIFKLQANKPLIRTGGKRSFLKPAVVLLFYKTFRQKVVWHDFNSVIGTNMFEGAFMSYFTLTKFVDSSSKKRHI